MLWAGRRADPWLLPDCLTPPQEIQGNPGRGWYRVYTFQPECRDEDQLEWLPLDPMESLAMVRLDIGAFRECKIDGQTLKFMQRIFRRFHDAEKEVILRVTYDTEGNGMEREPSAMDMVLTHMRQVGELVQENAADVFVAQGLFVGNWGEMHGSKFLAARNVRKLTETWLEATAGKVPVAFRKPSFCRMVFSEERDNMIGFYDDAMLASPDHLGTFGSAGRGAAGWEQDWTMEDELAYLQGATRRVPCGGEAIAPAEPVDSEQVAALLRRMQVSYLNSAYDKRLLDQWKQMRGPADAGPGESLYAYVGERLGYRFVVQSAKRERGRLKVQVKNTGFGRLYQEAVLSLVLKMEGGEEAQIDSGCDLRALGGGETAQVFFPLRGIHAAQASLRLVRRDGRTIKFANLAVRQNLPEGSIG